jgi:hypothetical protein
MRRLGLALLLLCSCTRNNLEAGGDVDGGGGDAGDDGGALQSGVEDLRLGCADVFGKYGMITAVGSCNDINVSAPECVAGTNLACVAHFVSAPAGAVGAVNGAVQVDGLSFTGAALTLGTVKRNCMGSFDEATGKLTITCGSGAEQCTVTMTRQGPCG